MNSTIADFKHIAETVQDYFDGLYHSDIHKLRNAFHTSAQVIGYFQGTLQFLSLDDFLTIIKDTPAPSQNNEIYNMKIVAMDRTGSVATVKVTNLYRGMNFTDHLTLLKIENEWVIINKAFHHD